MQTLTRMLAAAVLAAPLGLAAAPAFASDAHKGHSAADHATMSEGVHTTGVVNKIEGDTVNLTHEPIPEIGWPKMTMDLKLLEGAEVGAVKAGDEAMIMLEKGPDGLYGVKALMPKN